MGGEGNAGLLIFGADDEPPEYMLWSDVGQVEFDQPLAFYPLSGDH